MLRGCDEFIEYSRGEGEGETYRWGTVSLGLGNIGFTEPGSSMHGTAYDSRLDCYYGCLVEGGIVLDKRAPLEANPGLAYTSPMHDAGLKETSPFRDTDNWLLDMFAAEPGGYGPVARLAKACPGSFDMVPTDVYVAWWADKGARVGLRRGNTIQWSDGEVESIRPESQRWDS